MADDKTIVSFRALQLANEQRSAYGLRYNDFERYRKHCANRTHRLRSLLKMTHGKGREFKKLPPFTADNIKDGHLQLLLFEAERAWAYSQDLFAQSLKPANETHSHTLRHSATGRFRKSVNWATQLLSHCQSLHSASRLSSENLLQVTIYTLILNGRFLRYRDEFDDALVQLSVARGLLDELAAGASTSRDQALATAFTDEIGPEIRYCAHELGYAKAYDVDGIVADQGVKHREALVEGCDELVGKFKQEGHALGKGENKKKLETLMWEGEPVPVRSPELVDVLLKVQEAEVRLEGLTPQGQTDGGASENKKGKGASSKKGVASYDAILLALSDAEDVARKLVEAQQSSGASAGTSASGTRDIQFVHTYIVYQLLSRRIQRDLLLMSTLLSSHHSHPPHASKPASGHLKSQKQQLDARLYPAVVKLLDTVLQSLNQMRTLGIVDESPDLSSAVDARLSYTKAWRCLYLSRCYGPLKKYAEALTLTQHANIHLRETRSTLSLFDTDPITSGTPSYFPLTPANLDKLEADLSTDALKLKKDWFAFNGGSLDTDNKAYKKPLFFDIALNYVQLDMDRLQERAGNAKPAAVPKPSPAPATNTKSGTGPGIVQPVPEKKQTTRAKVEEVQRPATPESRAPARGGLSNLLGGWWGKS